MVPPSSLPSPGLFKPICLIATCTMAMLVNVINITCVSISLPVIGRELGIVETQLQWLVSAYALSSGCLLLVFGRLADLYGRKRVFIAGSSWLAIFSLACGFAPGSLSLQVLRGLQGVGAAASMPSSLGILAYSFPLGQKMRPVAFTTFAAGAPLGAVIGMAIGATLTQLSRPSWRSNFYLSSALTVFYIIIGIFTIDPDELSHETDRRVDWLGAALVTAGLVLIVFVLSDGEIAPQKWATPYVIACLLLGVILLGAFLFWQHYLESLQHTDKVSSSFLTPPPLMKLSLWTRDGGRFAAIMMVALFDWAAFTSWYFWAQLYYQDYKGYTPVLTMVRLFPMFVVGVLCNVLMSFIVGHISLKWILAVGTTLTSCATLLFALIDPNASYWVFGFLGACFSVFGADFVFAGGTMFVASIVLPHEQSLSGALFQMMTQVGTALGVTISTIVFNRIRLSEVTHDGVAAPSTPGLQAYKGAQWTAFTFGILATVLVIVSLRGVGVISNKSGLDEPSSSEVTNLSKDDAHSQIPAEDPEKGNDAGGQAGESERFKRAVGT
ncbi:putative efflux transporter [Pluteus cervinus]|uniref:Efflux transporter n=1 Tax=Pluteus cervinus TaxID=181527 RepID=A0ACD3AFD9_9AGAR|nr:putative efflux transporter [Pluteus cervinus]